MPREATERVTMLWPMELKEAVREEVGGRGLTNFTVAAVRAKLGTHDSHKEDSKELNEVRFLVQRLADSIALAGDYEDRESTLREIDLPPWVDTTGWPVDLARAINPEESTPEVVEQPVPGSEAGIKGLMNHFGMTQEGDGTKVFIDGVEVEQTYFQPDQDEDLHRPMALTRPRVETLKPEEAGFELRAEAPGVGDVVLSEPPKTAGVSLMDRVRAKAQEKGVDLSGVDLVPASEVEKLSPGERDAKLEQIRGPEVHNHSWAHLEDPHGIYPTKAYVCECGATMSAERVYPPGEVPAPQSEVTTEPAVELEVQPDAPSPVANACPKCQSPLVGDECWECF